MWSHDSLSLVLFAGFLFGFVVLAGLLRAAGSRYWAHFNHTVTAELGRSFLFINSARLFTLNAVVVSLCVVAILWLTRSPWPAVAVALLLAVLPRVLLMRMRRRRLQQLRGQLPELLSMLAGSLRAGAAVTAALADLAQQMPAPASQEMSLVLREHRMGSTFEQALGSLERRVPVEETVLLTGALRLGLRSGGSIAGTLDAMADAMRRKLVLEGKIRALTAQGKLQAWVMGLLPFFVLAATLFIDPSMTDIYFGSFAGWVVIGIVVLLQILGVALICRMIAIEI